MNLTLDLTTIMTFVAGLAGPVAVLAVFNRVAVKLSLPTIVEALMESAQFIDRMATKLAKHPEIDCAMRATADHKARNLQSGLEGRIDNAQQVWQSQFSALESRMDQNNREEREWRKMTTKQIDRMFRLLRHLDRADAKNEVLHDSIHDSIHSSVEDDDASEVLA